MKKFLLITITLFFYSFSNAQHPCGNHLDWDWTDPTSFDYAYLSGIGQVILSSPFNTESSASADLTLIIQAQDYLPEQGWVLLDKVFGCSSQAAQTQYPYFILYNKYTGILRLFIFNNSSLQHQRALVTFSWLDAVDRTSLLTHQNVISYANDFYSPTIQIDDKGLNYVQDYFSSAWMVTDFLVAFDNNTQDSKDYSMEFKLFSEIISDVDLSGEFEFTTKTSSIEGGASSKQVSENQQFSGLNNAKKFISKVPSGTELEKSFKQIDKALDTLDWGPPVAKLGNKLESLNQSLQNGTLKDFLIGAGNVASALDGGLGIVTSILNLFVSKSNTNAIQSVRILPTISNGSMSISGTIETQTNSSRYSLQLPGSNHRRPDGTLIYDGLPVYDCPLGVVALERTPAIKRVKSYPEPVVNPRSGQVSHSKIYYSYQIDDDVVIAHNKASGTEIISVMAQFVGKFPSGIYSDEENIIRQNLVDETFELSGYEYGKIVYTTPLIDLKKFKGTSFAVPAGFTYPNIPDSDFIFNENITTSDGRDYIEFYLRIVSILQPTEETHDQTPIVHSYTYNLNNFSDQGELKYGMHYYPFTCYQLVNCEPSPSVKYITRLASGSTQADIIETAGEFSLELSNESRTYLATESVSLKPGFSVSASAGGSLHCLVDPERDVNNTNSLVINEYFEGCNEFPNARIASYAPAPETLESNEPLQLKLFPNPASDRVDLFVGNGDENNELRIFDAGGTMVHEVFFQGYNYVLDISSLKTGLYFIHLQSGSELVTEKLVKQ